MNGKNVQKRQARPTRSIANPGDDHELGMWIDHEFLRRHPRRAGQIVLHNSMPAMNNRYLELADLVLGNKTEKKQQRKGKAHVKKPSRGGRFARSV